MESRHHVAIRRTPFDGPVDAMNTDWHSVPGKPETTARTWVRETSFGTWFLGTGIWSSHVLRVALDDLERLLKPRSTRYRFVLDVGCGRGRALTMLEQRFHPDTIIGLDVDPVALRLAASEAARCGCHVELLNGFVENIPLPDRIADMVFCHQTFHHLADQNAALREFYRVLKPGGVLLFAESCRRFIHSLPIRLLFRHPMHVQRSAREYVEMLLRAGFTFEASRISTPYLWWSRPALGAFDWLGRLTRVEREQTLLNVAGTRTGSSV